MMLWCGPRGSLDLNGDGTRRLGQCRGGIEGRESRAVRFAHARVFGQEAKHLKTG